jgi:hypothetical protein
MPPRAHAAVAVVAVLAALGCARNPSHGDGDVTDPAPDGTTTSGDPLPAFDAATTARVRELVAVGRARGQRHDVVAKLGDSITESRAFLFECGDGQLHPGAFPELADTVRYFTRTVLDADGFNALTRGSLSAVGGWSVADALDGGDAAPLLAEVRAIRPQWAIVMYGTNDLERVDAETFRAQLGRALALLEDQGVVPVVSTIPPRADDPARAARVPAFNDVIRALARERHVPLVDYWAALDAVPGHGLSDDGVHPSVYMEGATRTCDLSEPALRYGYNVRNLLALRMLARLVATAPP